MASTLRVVEYSVALWLATSNLIELPLYFLIGSPLTNPDFPLPYWLGPTALSFYVPVIVANVIVVRRPDVSRRRLWSFCLVVFFLFNGLLIPVLFIGFAADVWMALEVLVLWLVVAGFAYLFVIKGGYERFIEAFSV